MGSVKKSLKKLMEILIKGGIRKDHDVETERKVKMINIISIIGILNLIPFGISNLSMGNSTIGYFDFVVASVLIINQFHLRMTGNHSFSSYCGIGVAGALFLYLFFTGGVDMSGPLWFYTFPLFALFLLGSKRGASATLIVLFILIFFLVIKGGSQSLAPYTVFFKIRFVLSFLFVLSFAYLFETIRENIQDKLVLYNAELEEKIVEIKMTKEVMLESEKRYRALSDATFEAVFVSEKGVCIDANKTATKMFEYEHDELIGIFGTDVIAPESKELVKQNMLSGYEEPYQIIAQRKDKTTFHAEIRGKIAEYKNRRVRITVVRNTDRIKQREQELLQAKMEAEVANKAKAEFLTTMSHEIRTPLNHIMGFTELVAGKDVGDLNTEQEEYLNNVLESGRHLLSLINDILDLSKVEAGKMELEPSDVDLRMLLENSLVLVKEKALKDGIQLKTEVDEAPEVITADECKLKQIIYNLLSNAVKFTPDGGAIRLTADLAKHSLLFADSNREKAFHQKRKAMSGDIPASRKFVRISVTDTGIGLEPDDMERIFRIFEQVDGSTSRKHQGTGLGLSLTKKLVELHGGRIWAESEGEGKGSTFQFVIPV